MVMNQVTNKDVIHELIFFAIKHRKIMQHYLDKTGVFHAQHRILMNIYHHPNVSQNDLAKMMEVSSATIAVSLKKLESEGYINRIVDETDNRFHKINITEMGKQVIEQSKAIIDATDHKVLQDLTVEEMYNLFNLLKKINDNLVRMEEEIQLK